MRPRHCCCITHTQIPPRRICFVAKETLKLPRSLCLSLSLTVCVCVVQVNLSLMRGMQGGGKPHCPAHLYSCSLVGRSDGCYLRLRVLGGGGTEDRSRGGTHPCIFKNSNEFRRSHAIPKTITRRRRIHRIFISDCHLRLSHMKKVPRIRS